MAKRKRIGLLFYYNEDWIAGAYYILNIIHALNTLKDKQKPIIVIISNSKSNYNIVKTETAYPYLDYFEIPFISPYTFIDRLINKIFFSMFGYNLIKKQYKQPTIDFLYPFQKDQIVIKGLKKVNWVPDFQELHLPHLFSEELLNERRHHHKNVICKSDIVVFSSYDAQKDFQKLYPESKVKQFILNFAVTHPNIEDQDVEVLRNKYGLPKAYYFSPNQFWVHKNHIIVLKAVKYLKDDGINICVAFSGKETDHRNKAYFDELKAFVASNKLEKHITFLGFISRKEQLCLMQHSIAIVQPSLFEGWSTVVEDAKALNKHIILSNINLHKEQISKNCSFFDPYNSEELAYILKEKIINPPKEFIVNYDFEIQSFGKRFLELIELTK